MSQQVFSFTSWLKRPILWNVFFPGKSQKFQKKTFRTFSFPTHVFLLKNYSIFLTLFFAIPRQHCSQSKTIALWNYLNRRFSYQNSAIGVDFCYYSNSLFILKVTSWIFLVMACLKKGIRDLEVQFCKVQPKYDNPKVPKQETINQ